MIIAIDPEAVERYVPKDDRELPPENQTVFLLSPLRAKDAARLEDSIAETIVGVKGESSTLRIRSGSQILEALRAGLKGWENFRDARGNPVEWRENNGIPRPEMFDLIPGPVRRELAERIIEGRDLTEQEEKN